MVIKNNIATCDVDKAFIMKNDKGSIDILTDKYISPTRYIDVSLARGTTEENVLDIFYELSGEEMHELFTRYEAELREQESQEE